MVARERASVSATGAARFGTTQWSLVLRAGQGAEEALLKLCQIYWPPLYAFIRRRGHAVHEAQDLTQAFFAHVLSNRALDTVAPAKGRFRSFLLVALKHFLDNEWHKARAVKRGGRQVVISWEELNPGERDVLGPREPMTPEKAFNRRWALRLLERVMKRLRSECAAARKEELFEAVKGHLTGDGGGKPYQEIAAEFGMTEGAVKVTVHRLRRRFGELVREQIGRTVETPEEIDDEIRELFAALM
ncbi:MAG: sigma-70 family RNA polymerase sigma factor [Verrucomicrobia subdivision 3 bacterium]|nr:sigma-70 family RNA polymerase sigma factor [Limisphaerales bacterium]